MMKMARRSSAAVLEHLTANIGDADVGVKIKKDLEKKESPALILQLTSFVINLKIKILFRVA